MCFSFSSSKFRGRPRWRTAPPLLLDHRAAHKKQQQNINSRLSYICRRKRRYATNVCQRSFFELPAKHLMHGAVCWGKSGMQLEPKWLLPGYILMPPTIYKKMIRGTISCENNENTRNQYNHMFSKLFYMKRTVFFQYQDFHAISRNLQCLLTK